MLNFYLVLILSASVWSESQVRETETWMPLRTTQTAAMLTHRDLEGSGSDFGFTDEDDSPYDDVYDYDEFSGSGDGATTVSTRAEINPSAKPDVDDNRIPDEAPRATVNQLDVVRNSNEIPLLRGDHGDQQLSNVLMSHAGDNSVLNKTEFLAAVIAGAAIGLMSAVLLILLLIYRMKKKDEGSYDLGKKPIYKKAATTEIYA
ncbi:syndecan-4 isoform X1 [Takifugu flavidus]|uniref:syndecan-4 isoform X1 n=1 Tax=Takifugu flavidus TaxID=433684 RepID=UPI00254424D2|nr:syndecan-4 isoform X1 [Takifugu flavidus]